MDLRFICMKEKKSSEYYFELRPAVAAAAAVIESCRSGQLYTHRNMFKKDTSGIEYRYMLVMLYFIIFIYRYNNNIIGRGMVRE